MESSTLNKDQEIAGSAADLFEDSSSPFDAIFDTRNSTFQTSTQQDNQSAASFFDNLASEQSSQAQQATTEYPSYYEYNHNLSTLQEGTYDTVTNATVAQQHNLTTGYDYGYGQYVSTNTNSATEGVNSSVDPQSAAAQYQYDYTGYGYDTSYNGQDYSQYYDYSQQQQYYDPNDPYSYYYYDPSTYTQGINNSNGNNFQNHTQGSINIEQQQNSFQELPDQANSGKYEEQRKEEKGIPDNIQINSIGEVDKSLYNELKPNVDGALKFDAELADVPPESSTTDIGNNDNENLEFSPDNDKENKEMPQEMKFSIQQKSIEKKNVVPTSNFKEHLTISSSNNLTSSNNEDVAAVALVETIETNQENAQFTVSAETGNDSSIEKDNELNEDQEVNIIHGDDHDIFEYQHQELESHPKSELSHFESPVSSLTDESRMPPEISAATDAEEINNKLKDDPAKLDDLDDLVLGSTSKSNATELEGVSKTQERYSISTQNDGANSSSFQHDQSGLDYQYNYGYNYQEFDVNQTTSDTATSTDFRYQGNDASQATRDTTAGVDHANYQYDTGQTASNSTTDKYISYDSDRGDVNQYPSQMMAENSSAYQYSGYEANQFTAVNAITETDQSNYQYHTSNVTVDTTTEQEQSNYQYQAYGTTINDKDAIGQYAGYDTNQVNYQVGTDKANYQYQEYETVQSDAKAITDQSNYQYYQGYQPNSTSHLPKNSPPPTSPSPKGSNLISCPSPQCGGENKVTAKFCSDCGKPINNASNTKLYNNNLNAYSGQSLSYDHSQSSYSASSFASYDNHSTSINDTQFSDRDPGIVLDTYQLDQQQYYGTDDIVNDPLGRSKGCRPIVAFGFGGKIYTMFPRTVQRFTSTDQNTPITKSAPGAFTVRALKNIIPTSDIDNFPGPLLMDNNKGGVKAKKKSVLKYLNDQIQITENNIISFIGEAEKIRLEAILVVWNLFKIMFENEGILTGSPKVEELVRKILVPSASKSDNDEANFTVPADTSFDSQESLSQTPEASLLTYSVSTKAVDKLQELLLKGDRVVAIRHAMNENLWAHALIIASCVNKDLWKEVVTGFVKHEMGTHKGDASESNGRESLRVLYSLFAGQGQNAAKEFLPYSNLFNQVAQSPATAIIHNSNPNIPYGVSKTTLHISDHKVPFDNLVKWRETIAMILANRAPGDNQTISALGDTLKEYGWIHAAHACYILSPNVSITSGFDTPNTRFTILGNDYTHNPSINNFYDWQSLHMTEIYEFGLSLNSNDGGLPHLQAYKLLYAWWLADCGYLNEARRYCESIANIVKVYTKGSPYFHGCFLQKLKDLTQRLLEHGGNSNGTNESSSWLFAKKMPKGTLDSIWGSLEGKFIKFVAGDVVDENVKETLSSSTHETIGPFSHFSSITHPTSEVPSRSASASDFRPIPNPTLDMRRATTPNAIIQKQLNGNQRRSSTPGVGLANGGYNTFSPTTSDGQNTMASVPEGESLETSPIEDKNGYYEHFGGQDQRSYGYSSYNHYDNNQQSVTNNGYNSYSYVNSNDQQSVQSGYDYSSLSDNSGVEANNKQKQQTNPYYQPLATNYKNDSAWWNNPNADSTDTAEDQKADQTQTDDVGEGEFISLMDNNFASFVPAPAPVTTSTTGALERNSNFDENYDDLGLGNDAFGSKKKNYQNTESAVNTNNETKSDTSQTEEKQEEKQEEQKEEKKGWFDRFFGKKEGGKTANLGEENTFYYDPVQKRWINKKAGAEANNTLSPPPPPPQRSKTTSPLPSRSMTSSNPNRQSLPSINNSPPSSTSPPPNKGGRASSASMKRSVRSRYVDIMNQPPPN